MRPPWTSTTLPIAIFDEGAEPGVADLAARFSGSPTFTVVAVLNNGQPVDSLIDSRQVQKVLVIDRCFTRDLLTHQPAPVELILDGCNSNTALLTEGYASAITWTTSHRGLPTVYPVSLAAALVSP